MLLFVLAIERARHAVCDNRYSVVDSCLLILHIMSPPTKNAGCAARLMSQGSVGLLVALRATPIVGSAHDDVSIASKIGQLASQFGLQAMNGEAHVSGNASHSPLVDVVVQTIQND